MLIPLSVTLEDSGELIMVASTFGVAHPPGYPLYSLIGGLFSLLPTGNLAFNLNLMSLVFGVMTLAVLYRVMRVLGAHPMIALFGVAIGGMAPTVVWYFSVAEVYSLFTFCFFVCVYFLLTEKSPRWSWLFAGLGLCAHWPLFVFASPALLMLRPSIFKSARPRTIGLLLLGLSPYLYLWIRGQGGDYLTTGRIDSFQDWTRLIAMKQVGGVQGGFDWANQLRYFLKSHELLQNESSLVGYVLTLIAIGFGLRARDFKLAGALAWLIFGSNLVLQGVVQLPYDVLFAEEVEQFHILPLLSMGIAASIGADLMIFRHLFRFGRSTMLIAPLGAIACLYLQWPHYHSVSQNFFASEIAKTYLLSMPDNAMVLLHGDADVGPMTYMNRVAGVRPDLKLVSQNGFLIRPEGLEDLVDYESKLSLKVKEHLVAGGRVVALRLQPSLRLLLGASGLQFQDFGLFTEISDRADFAGPAANAVDAVKFFADRYVNGALRPTKWIYLQEALIGPLCKFLLREKVSHPLLESTVYCRYYSLRDLPPSEDSKPRAKKLWDDARIFPADERDTIFDLVSKLGVER